MSMVDPDGRTPVWMLPDPFVFWFYRVGGYVVLHLLDEPAWLALMFC